MASAKKTTKKATAKSTAKKAAKKPAKKAIKVKKKTARRSSKTAKAEKKEERSFDVSKHVLVPKHEVLGEDELAGFFEKYSVQPTNLPTISINDAALKGLDAKMGDVIRISRKSLTAQQSVFFRRVSYE